MAERNLFGSHGEFVGSVDDDGRIYNDRHLFMGRVENGTIYDNCNIPQGRITESGMVLDNHYQEVGQEYGTGFCSPGPRREMGRVRADILSEGRGRDYGAFHLLDRNDRHRYDPYPYDEDGGEIGDDDGYGDDDCDYDDDCGYDNDETVYASSHRSRHRAGQGKKDELPSFGDDPVAGCAGCGCLVFFVIWLFIALQLYSGGPFSGW